MSTNKRIDWVDVAKGIEESTLKRLSEVIKDEIPLAKEVTLSGPSHAEEVSVGEYMFEMLLDMDCDSELVNEYFK